MSQAATPQQADTEPSEQPDLSKNVIFDLLRNQRRRFVVHYLMDNPDEEVTLGQLADQVAAWEYEVSCEEVSSTQRKRVYTTLQQSHLPKMDDAGIVRFDQDRGTITPRAVVGDLNIYLEIVPGREFAWHEFYLGLGAVFTALMVAVWTGIPPFASVAPIIWGTILSVAVVLSAAVHVYTQRRMGIGTGEIPQELDHEQ